eukprot:3724573-Prymnesium_polylepis.1
MVLRGGGAVGRAHGGFASAAWFASARAEKPASWVPSRSRAGPPWRTSVFTAPTFPRSMHSATGDGEPRGPSSRAPSDSSTPMPWSRPSSQATWRGVKPTREETGETHCASTCSAEHSGITAWKSRGCPCAIAECSAFGGAARRSGFAGSVAPLASMSSRRPSLSSSPTLSAASMSISGRPLV